MAPPPRRPQRAVAITVAFLVAVGGIFAVTRAFDRGTQQHPTGYGQTASSEPSPSGGVFGAMDDAIRASSPSGWSFSFTRSQTDGDWIVDATVDDGNGPGRLHVEVSTQPGALQLQPCSEQDSAQGAKCSTYYLIANGQITKLAVATAVGGTNSLTLVLTHADQAWIAAEAQVTRAQPLYTLDQMAELVQAVDHAVQDCLSSNC